jgi:hypothetical protein
MVDWLIEYTSNGHQTRSYAHARTLDEATNKFAAQLAHSLWPSNEDDVKEATFTTHELPDGRLLIDVRLDHKDGNWTGTTKAAKFTQFKGLTSS